MINRSPRRHTEGGNHLPSFTRTVQNESVRIVCLALGLACVMLTLRIASMW
jgi:hypothetical protein